jgi:uncharacterized protein (DUF1330 family)
MNNIDDLNTEALARLAADPSRGPIAMLNLLKFRPDGGRERFGEYVAASAPCTERAGARLVYAGECGEMVIGDEDWDLLVVVEYPTAGAFTSMIQSDEYQAVVHLRQESLVRSVLYETSPVVMTPPGD